MAEYFPLLDRAVSGLTEPTAEARRSIYERARTALIGQLRRMEPAIPEEDIARESTALDEAIARVEARFAAGAAAAPDPPPAATSITPPSPPAPSSTVQPPAPPPVAAAARVPPPSLPTGAPPIVPPPSRERPTLGPRVPPSVDRPTVRITPAPAASRPPPRSTAPLPARGAPPPRGTRPVMALRPVPDAPLAEARDALGLPAAGRLATETPGAEAAGLGEDRAVAADDARPGAAFAEALDAAGRADPETEAGQPAPRLRDAALRPAAPRPRPARRIGWPVMTFGLVGLIVVSGIGVAAYKMRDRPEQVVAGHAQTASPAEGSPGKVVERASPAAAGTAAAPEPAASGVAVPPPVAQGSDAGPAAPSIAVAQRAALLVDAPEEPQRVKTYVGTVVWHLDSVSPGQGQPLASAVKADVDIPEAKLKVTMLMQKNPEPQLPASHTIEFHFLPQPGNALGNVKQINVPEMRKDDDAPTGDPLAGVPVAITENYFLVGLSRGGSEGQNMRLVSERNWFDMSVLFTSGKLGKLTFEKGVAGQRTFEDALNAWK